MVASSYFVKKMKMTSSRPISDALKALTGAPVDFYSHDFYTDQELW
jgi:hypothetical protein